MNAAPATASGNPASGDPASGDPASGDPAAPDPFTIADARDAAGPADKPAFHISIRPTSGWGLPDFRELWRYRDLLVLLTIRNLSAKYRQSVLGLGWAVIRPAINLLVFTVVFGRVVGLDDAMTVPYPLFAFCGLTLWTFFAGARNTTASVVSGQSMLTKVYFPRLVLPLSSVGGAWVDLAVQCVLLVALLIYYQIVPPVNVLALPAFLLLATVAAFAVGLWLTSLNVKYRDVGQAVPFLLQIGMYLSPVIYPPKFIPERYEIIYYLNPMAGAIEGVRWCVLGSTAPHWGYVGLSVLTTLLILGTGLMYFRKTENTFADII